LRDETTSDTAHEHGSDEDLIQSEAAQHLSSAVGGHTPFRSGLMR
jgi:hypothetical protein